MMRFVYAFLPMVAAGASQASCDPDPEFECAAHCLADAVDDGMVQHSVTDVIHAADLGAAVTACESWLTCTAGPSDQSRCFCTEVH
jgi:hypothetical protein